ncbi:citrate lyase holo-[acyl-carrier protein] synthase [Youngiibacter multivorans]|uniref:Holo-ACP synthase CitX n=1 Tax=Youngiibacter multivorans TaxID=937251 RepID=A0ABS4G3A3_9CLOT|nr:citrate lyase holo-[acyl-carrier protein] synthase [Youngiibacter multivorans]MBP1918996.1 holo-ACP synthase CitX [Youngiibacter multivorans]
MASILDLREKRDEYEKNIASSSGKTLITVRPNYPGSDKRNIHSNFVSFSLAYEVESALEAEAIHRTHDEEGLILFLLSDRSKDVVKRTCVDIEDSHPLGRLADIDVTDDEGSLSRTDLGLFPRKCYICEDYAAACTRSARHGYNEITKFFSHTVERYLTDGTLAAAIEKLTSFSLLAELCRETGFGCVNVESNGSHKDMDFWTFTGSIRTVSQGFGEITSVGANDFYNLRKFGLELEQRMFNATGGINTHKGAIFIYLLMLQGLLESSSYGNVKEEIKRISRPVLEDFGGQNDSNGLRAYRQHGILGIRGEAAGGFPKLFGDYLKVLEEDFDLTRLSLAVMSDADDTNVIHRAGIDSLRELQSKSRLAQRGAIDTGALESWCIDKNISTGGSADLVGATVFAHLIKNNYRKLKGEI